MKQFSESNFDHIFIPLAIPILKNAGLIQMVNKNSNSPYTDTDNVNLNTICKLTDVTIKHMKSIRKGSRIKSRKVDHKEIFTNLNTIINGHSDETNVQNAFKNHNDERMYIPTVKLKTY
ncbi:MAG: hypothetical protein M8352_05065 [ANME-2 cluster archaeon]|nr:hypothetical protein [ANME-2 cluster archaeon]MDF1531125.1 hypothetical protein [ANME-2 cluster archaeon]